MSDSSILSLSKFCAIWYSNFPSNILFYWVCRQPSHSYIPSVSDFPIDFSTILPEYPSLAVLPPSLAVLPPKEVVSSFSWVLTLLESLCKAIYVYVCIFYIYSIYYIYTLSFYSSAWADRRKTGAITKAPVDLSMQSTQSVIYLAHANIHTNHLLVHSDHHNCK